MNIFPKKSCDDRTLLKLIPRGAFAAVSTATGFHYKNNGPLLFLRTETCTSKSHTCHLTIFIKTS